MKNYSDTLNLPKTDFSMKANLPEKEPRLVEQWERNSAYRGLFSDKKFFLHDGPPYANGDIHLGTAFNKILKDVVLKYKRMKGFEAAFIPGWDTHGLPIELAVTKEISEKDDVLTLRKRFKEHASKYIDRQRKDFKRLGILADWDNPYITFDPKFEANQLRIFADLVEKDYVYRSLKPVYWCTTTRTALAEAEIVYKDHVSDSIYLKFKATKSLENKLGVSNLYFAVWTTTPWTLPANLAVALHPEMEYSVVRKGDEHFIIASSLLEQLREKLKIEEEAVSSFQGREIENFSYEHPFMEREGSVVLAEHVTGDSGTGCVHTAPGHGIEDFLVGNKYGLGVICPVDNRGYMTDEAGPLSGMFYLDANKKVIELLGDSLILSERITHSYPYSERGKTPIIFRATEQWFVKVEGRLRERALDEISKVKFFPSWSVRRLESMMQNRPDWCISRQRVWGVPIPVFYCAECGKALLDADLIREISDEVEKAGSEIFVRESADYFLRDRYKCCGGEFKKGEDIFDVWFDSGTSYASVLKEKADLYLEGTDQHRGWFQTSLITSVGARGEAPYRAILTHGFVVDGDGIKMSKSIGNVIAPQQVVDKYGADILRLWTNSVDMTGDVKMSEEILKQNVETYRKIRNAFRFMLGNIEDLEGEEINLLKIDRLALNRLSFAIREVESLFDKYEFHNGLTVLVNFVTEMSAFYLDIIKDRLYTDARRSVERRSAQTVLSKMCSALARVLAPILSFTSEEVWGHLSEGSIFSQPWPEIQFDEDQNDLWNEILSLREEINSKIERLIQEGEVKTSSQVEVLLNREVSDFNAKELREMLKVAEVKIDNSANSIGVKKFNGVKCERCWLYYNKIEGEVCERCREVLEG